MSRVFLSHSSHDSVAALALKTWLESAEPGLVDEIFLDLDPDDGIPAGVRWKEALRRANERCEAVICLLSEHWDSSYECKTEYRIAEDRGKPIFPVRLASSTGRDITSEWQRCDLFGDGQMTAVTVDGQAEPVRFLESGLLRLQKGLRAAGIAPDSFEWPPDDDPHRAPYRGWQPLEAVDAAIYFGRDAQINRALSALRGLRSSGENQAFVILGPSGVGKSSFLRAGLLPRLRRDDRHFLPMEIVRPERHPLTGPYGLARSIHALRAGLGLTEPGLGTIKAGAGDAARVRGWLVEAQHAAIERFLDDSSPTPPTIMLPVDQAEELFGVEAGEEAGEFLTVVAGLLRDAQPTLPIVVAVTVRADRFEPLQTAPQLAGLAAPRVFEDLRPMPPDRYREVICGPAVRAQRAGSRLQLAPELVEALLADSAAGADALPLLSLTLARLYEDYGDGVVGLTEYEAMGGMRRVVESEIDAVLSAAPDIRERELQQLHDAFIPWLAAINPVNDEPLRRAARWADLPADSHPLIEALVARRLLVKDERDGTVVVEVALESLLRQWDTLAGWLRDEAADLKHTDAIEQASRDWEHNARHDDWLLPGERLAEAEALAAKPGFRDRLNASRGYLLASRQREDRRAKDRQDAADAFAASEQRAKVQAQHDARVLLKRTRVLYAVLALVVVVAVVAVIGFVKADNAREDADARFRDATASSMSERAQLVLAGQTPGGIDDVIAMQALLAALAISDQHDAEHSLLTLLNHKCDLLKVIDVPAVVTSVAFSPDGPEGPRIASGYHNGTIRLWNPDTGKPIGEPLHGTGQVNSLAFSPDGLRLVAGDEDGTVRVWDTARSALIRELRAHEGAVTSVAVNRDGTRIASGGADNTVRLWDAAGRQIGQMRHDDVVMSVAFSIDGRLASGGADNTVRVWDAAGRQIAEMRHEGAVEDVAFSPDGTRVVSGGDDRMVRLWDTTGRPVVDPMRHENSVYSVAFSPDGTRIASGGIDKAIRLWDTVTGQPAGVLSGHRLAVRDVAFSPNGPRLVSGGEEGTIRVWDTASWQPVLGHGGTAFAGFFDNGHRIGSGSVDGTVRWWDPTTLRPIGEPLRIDGANGQTPFPVDENRLVSIDSTTVQLWDTRTRTPLGEPLHLPRDPEGVLAADDAVSRIAAQVEPGVVQVWNTANMQPTGPPIRQEQRVRAIAFSTDGLVVATGSTDFTVRLWKSDTGEPIGQAMQGNAWVTGITFSRDGSRLAAAYMDSSLRLWDTHTFQPVGDPMAVDSQVSVAAFSEDGRTVAAGSDDGSIQLWNVDDQAPLGASFDRHSDYVTSLDFSPDGTKLLSASADRTLRMSPVMTHSRETLRDALCAKLTHNISHEMWNEMVPSKIHYIKVCPDLPDTEWAG